MQPFHHQATRMALGAVVLLMIGSCRGPQSLDAAIRPSDEASYLRLASESNGSVVEAYYRQRAEMKQITLDEARQEDIHLSTSKNPFDSKRDQAAVSRGAVIYKYQCASCHGFEGDGRGPDMPVYLPEMDFRRFGRRFSITLHGGAPTKWFDAVLNGCTSDTRSDTGETIEMSAYGDQLAREQIWQVVTYLQSFESSGQERD